MDQKIKEITLYATFTCPYCKMEKNWLESKGIKHKVVMVDLNPYEAEKMVKETGQMGVPVAKFEYENAEPQFVIGFDQRRLSDVLKV